MLDAEVTAGAAATCGLDVEAFSDGFGAGSEGLVGIVVLLVLLVVFAVVVESGGVEDLGLSPAKGDGARRSSTGLFC